MVLPPLISVAFFTLLERKVLSIIGFRLGPNKVSLLGIFQPLADAIKLCNKSLNYLRNFSFFFYYLTSIFMLVMSLSLFLCLDSVPMFISFKFTFLVFFLILGFNSLNFIVAGWSAYRKFSLIGRIRSVSQLISYEAVLYLCLFFFILIIGCFDISSFTFFGIFLPFFIFFPCFYFWVPTMLAELNRSPYDFSEGERELVRGFNTEFGSSSFTLIFLSEYANIIFFCLLSNLFFFYPIYMYIYFFFFVIWIRSVLPRYRFDKLMNLSWKFFIPFLTLYYCLFLLFFF